MYLGEKQFGKCKIEKGLMLTKANFHQKLVKNKTIKVQQYWEILLQFAITVFLL